MGISRGYVFGRRDHSPILLSLLIQGEHLDRQDWPRPPCRFWSAHNHLGPREPFVLKLAHAGWHLSMDGPRAYLSEAVQPQQQSSNYPFGLLCSRNGDIRNYQREPAISQGRRPSCLHEGSGRRPPSPRGKVCRESVEVVGTVLGSPTERPPRHRRSTSVFENGPEFAGATPRVG